MADADPAAKSIVKESDVTYEQLALIEDDLGDVENEIRK
jgi:hypothetical protein